MLNAVLALNQLLKYLRQLKTTTRLTAKTGVSATAAPTAAVRAIAGGWAVPAVAVADGAGGIAGAEAKPRAGAGVAASAAEKNEH